jgi:hypothetical protein
MIGGIRYCASKKFSELAALELRRRPEVNYKLTVLCPPSESKALQAELMDPLPSMYIYLAIKR